MKSSLFIFLSLTLLSCGKQGAKGTDGFNGATVFGANAVSTGVDFFDLGPGLACANGGLSIFTFHDLNSDGLLTTGEDTIKVKAICNGLNGADGEDGEDGEDGVAGNDGQDGEDGQDGANGTNGTNATMNLENVASSAACPHGGVKISSGSNAPVEVCNGVNGLNGENGIQGEQGIPGLNGANGSVITPVKFCEDDKSTFPEYGLLIDDELFAVYWGTTPASPKTPQAFLTKLVAGNYKSTGGNNCIFAVK